MPANPFIVAEIGTSHGGNLLRAKELIHAAAESGADGIKTQIVFADEIIHPLTGDVPLPGGDIPLYTVFKNQEKKVDFYAALKEETEKQGIEFLASPFGFRSLKILLELNVKRIKIASPELNHFPLLKAAKESGLPLILSNGVSQLDDIDKAIDMTGSVQTILLQCITSYPAPESDYNLNCLPLLAERYNIKTGVSDHSLDPLLVPLLATAKGAVLIEKHICLSRSGSGLDDPVALEPEDFSCMTRGVRESAALKPETIIENAIQLFSSERVNAVLGNGVYTLSSAEAANYGRTNRSLHALKKMEKGDIITKENTALLRTEKILRPGMLPDEAEKKYGFRLNKDIPSGEGIRLQDMDINHSGEK